MAVLGISAVALPLWARAMAVIIALQHALGNIIGPPITGAAFEADGLRASPAIDMSGFRRARAQMSFRLRRPPAPFCLQSQKAHRRHRHLLRHPRRVLLPRLWLRKLRR